MPRTSIEKAWLGGAALVAIVIAVVGYFFLISPQRGTTSAVQAQVASAQLQTSTLQARIVSLNQQQKKLATFRTALVKARNALPTVDDLSANPSLLKSLQRIAQQTGTSVSSLTIGNPTSATPTPASTSTSTTTSSTPSTTAAPASSLYSVAITTTVNGSATSLIAFLADLQNHQPRAILITGVNINAAAQGTKGTPSMNLTMTAFVRPATSAASTSTTPGAAAGTP